MSPTSSSAERHGGQWFPRWFIWPLFFLTSALRVYYVMQPDNWWIMHPDEIYQTMEVAHSEVYGYGFRTFEFNPPIDIKRDIPGIRRQEYSLGMAALRSFLPPHAYVVVSWLLQCLGFDFAPFVTWKVVHTLGASTLLLAVYRYVIVVFQSHDTACLAAILCAACVQLHVLGTHTFVNSLLAPLVFLSLAHFHTLMSAPPSEPETENTGKSSETKSDMMNGSRQENGTPQSVSNLSQNHKNNRKEKIERNTTNEKIPSSLPSNYTNGLTPIKGHVVNRHKPVTNGHTTTACNGLSGGKQISKERDKAITQNGHGPVLINGLHPTNHIDPCSKTKVYIICTRTLLKNIIAGFVIGVCVYVRVDVTAFVFFSLLPHWSPFHARYRDLIVSALGTVAGVALGVFYDFRCYGWGVLTPYNWFKFNVEKDYSTLLFGTEERHKYIMDIFFQNAGTTVLTVISCVCIVVNVSGALQSKFQPRGRESKTAPPWPNQSAVLGTSVSCLLLLLLYSCKGHKELRFVHNVIALVMVTCAALLRSVLFQLPLSREAQRLIVVMGAVLFSLNQWQDVASLTDRSNSNGNVFAFKQTSDTQDVNRCLYYVSSRRDVTGVFIERNQYGTGGYTVLHKDVPVFTMLDRNFYEYRVEDRLKEPTKTVLGQHQTLSVSYMGHFSNFVSVHNHMFVMKFVMEDQRYNYLVTQVQTEFDSIFGPPVFTCKTYKVYRRSKKQTREHQQLTQKAIINRTLKANGSVLIHEADMLFYHGAWSQATERYQLALQVDPSRVGAYLPLAACYHRLGDTGRASKTMQKCYNSFGRTKCDERRQMLVDVSADYD